MHVYSIGPFELDPERMTLTHRGKPVALGPKVVETLLALGERSGEPLSKAALLDRIWPEGFVEEANLAQNIYVLRKLFRTHGAADPIATIPRFGYQMTLPLRAIAPRPASRLAVAAAAAVLLSIALAVGGSSGLAQRDDARHALSARGAQNYDTGRYYWNLRTREGVRKSLDFFAHVIDSDPQDARGYAAMADANVSMADYCFGTHRPSVYLARAREYAKRAVARDADAAEVHATLGFLALHDADIRTGTRELRRAVALAPSYSPAHAWYGIALIRGGHYARGIQQVKAAAELDPLFVPASAWLGSAALREGRFGEAVVYLEQALELAPSRTDALRIIGAAYEALGDTDRALEAYRRYGAVDPFYAPQANALQARALARRHHPPKDRSGFALAAQPAHPSWATMENAATLQVI